MDVFALTAACAGRRLAARRWMRLLLVSASLMASPAMSSPPPTPDEQAAMAATQAACDAIRLRDLAALERLLAPDFTLVGPGADVQSRAQVIDEVKAGDPAYERFENHGMTARTYGDTAVVLGITSLKGRSGGKPFAVDVRFTDTLVRRGGRWALVASHVTRMP